MKADFLDLQNSDIPDRTNGVRFRREDGILPYAEPAQREKWGFKALDIEFLAEACLERSGQFMGSTFTDMSGNYASPSLYDFPWYSIPDTVTKCLKASQIDSFARAIKAMRKRSSTWYVGWTPHAFWHEPDWVELTDDFTYNDYIMSVVRPLLLPELPDDWCEVSKGDPFDLNLLYNPADKSGLYAELAKMKYMVFAGGSLDLSGGDANMKVFDSDTTGDQAPYSDGDWNGLGAFLCRSKYEEKLGDYRLGRSAFFLPDFSLANPLCCGKIKVNPDSLHSFRIYTVAAINGDILEDVSTPDGHTHREKSFITLRLIGSSYGSGTNTGDIVNPRYITKSRSYEVRFCTETQGSVRRRIQERADANGISTEPGSGVSYPGGSVDVLREVKLRTYRLFHILHIGSNTEVAI